MVLLSKHLVADSYWMEFLEDPCFKKKWLIWGKTNVSCFFSGIMIWGSCGLLHMEIWLFNLLSYFQQTRLVLFLIGHFWEEGRVPFKWYTWNCFKTTLELSCYLGAPQQDHVLTSGDNVRAHVTLCCLFLCSGGKFHSVHWASHFQIKFYTRKHKLWAQVCFFTGQFFSCQDDFI